MSDFVSLHNQTSYSILDALPEPKALLQKAKDLGQTAVAITDHMSIAGAWEGLKASKETGVKLIIGCEFYFQDEVNSDNRLRHLVLLAKNAIGYRNLLTLNKKGFDQGLNIGKKVYSVIDWKLLEQYAEGLICLTACGNGIICQLLMNQKKIEAEQTLLKLQKIFGDNLGLEVQPNHMKRGNNLFNDSIDQAFLNRQLINMGQKHGIKVVAACNAQYLNKEDADTHDTFLAISSHQPKYSNFRLKYNCEEFYLKSGQEVKEFFARNYGDELAQTFLDNSVYFAGLCEFPEWIDPSYSNAGETELPEYPIKNELNYNDFLLWWQAQNDQIKQLNEISAYLRYTCFSNFEKNFKHKIPEDQHQKYIDRMETELDVLNAQNFGGYFLIVWDLIRWCKNNNIPTGFGRGSAASSLLGYFLDIHKADPFKYNLIFERFQTKDRKKIPDIDSDIATSGRDKAIQYLIQKYGADYIAGISNFNTITAKIFLKDVARACEMGGNKDAAIEIGNNLAGLIPDLNRSRSFETLKQSLPLLDEHTKKYNEFNKYAGIFGKRRNFSAHAAAIVIGKRPLVGLVPLRKDNTGYQLIEYEKDTTEDNGLLKLDLLGLSSLDDIARTISLINRDTHKLSLEDIDFEAYDKKTYDLISSGDTYGVFQLGTSSGMISLCKRIKPKSIDDLAIITTLGRPAAKNIRDEFIKTREGKKEFTLLHPSLKDAFEKTYGYGLFDESILQLGRSVAGWTFNEADRIRKMIKDKGKNQEKNKKLREEFIECAFKNNNIEPIIGTRIWDEEIKKFQEYTFNRAHATTYSFVSFITAYLKAHYPLEFLLANLMAEVISNAPKAKDNVVKVKKELKDSGIKILPPHINTSEMNYSIKDKNKLLTGFQSIKYVSDDAIQEILAKRPFKNFFDFMARVSSKTIRSNCIQAMASCGMLDCFGLPRKAIFLYCSDYRKKLTVWLKKHNPNTEEFQYPFDMTDEWNVQELYALEQYYIGEAFICKPSVAYGKFFDPLHTTIQEVKKLNDRTQIQSIRGIVVDCFEFKIKKEGSKLYGKVMAKVTIEDKNHEQISLTIFPDNYEQLNKRIKELNKKAVFEAGLAIHFSGSVNYYEENIALIFNNLYEVSMSPAQPADLKAKKMSLKQAKSAQNDNIDNLFDNLEEILIDEGLVELDEND